MKILPNHDSPLTAVFLPPLRSGSFALYTEHETQAFLESIDDIDDTIGLWDSKSGIPGLLRAVPKSTLANGGDDEKKKERSKKIIKKIIAVFLIYYFLFDQDRGVFRFGQYSPASFLFRLIPVSRVKLGVYRVSKADEKFMADLTQQLIDGKISERQWYNAMRKAMKNQYRASYIAAIGGIENYDRSEISRFGWKVRPQYRWLDNFLLEIQSGKQPLNSFATLRARMYARAGNGIYQNTILDIAERNGKKYAARVLGPNENHCHDSATRSGCIELAKTGVKDSRDGLYYVPIDQAVPIGSATCLSFCLCEWRFK